MARIAAKRIAAWSPARDVWETGTAGLFCEHLDVFSGTWPSSGMTRGGVAYALRTSGRRTAATESSSSPLLPTPRTSDTNGAGAHGQGGPDLRTAVTLLPTPRASDGTNGGPNQRGSSGDLMLPSVVHRLLPTPRATRGGSGTETVALLPTPTATPYGSNQSASPGAAVRPSLDGTVRLLPTPSVADGTGGHATRSGARSDELLLPGVAQAAAGKLLPTPTTMDSRASGGSTPANVTLTDATVRTNLGTTANPRHGDRTPPPSTDGRQPWDVPLPLPPS